MEHGAPTKIGPPEKHKGPPNSPATGSIPVVGAPNATPPPSETRKTQSGASHHSQSSLSRGRGLTPEERGVFRCTQNLQISMAGAGPLNTVYNKDRHDHHGHPLNNSRPVVESGDDRLKRAIPLQHDRRLYG